jgi:hypothetical protein
VHSPKFRNALRKFGVTKMRPHYHPCRIASTLIYQLDWQAARREVSLGIEREASVVR